MLNRSWLAEISAAVVVGCGGGGDAVTSGWLNINGSSDRVTSDSTMSASGTAFVPAGSSCEMAGSFSYPGCLCTIGSDARLIWLADRVQASGSGEMLLPASGGAGCGPTQLWWRILDVPLELGKNVITITLSDGKSSGSSRLNVIRN